MLVLAGLTLSSCDQFDGSTKVKDAVSEKLANPSNAQFRNVKKCKDRMVRWTGEVNAKNRFGAYTGYKRFYATVFNTLSDVSFEPNRPARNLIDAKKDLSFARFQATCERGIFYGNDSPEAERDICFGKYCPCDKEVQGHNGEDLLLCQSIRAGEVVSKPDEAKFREAVGLARQRERAERLRVGF